MFIGTVPAEARLIIQELLKTSDREKEIWVGCSGNFTIDKLCHQSGRKVHSNDVSLYSKLIADIVQKNDMKLEVKNDRYAKIFDQWKDSPYKKLVMVMYILNVAEFEDCKNSYKTTMYQNLLDKHQEFYKKTLEKFERNKPFDFEIENFHFGDFRDHLDNSKGIGFVFAPTYTGGYEKLYKRAEEVFEYERADYRLFDVKDAEAIYAGLLNQSEMAIYSDKFFKSLEDQIIGKVVMGGNKKDIYLYSSVEIEMNKMFLFKHDKIIKKSYKLIPEDFEFKKNTRIDIVLAKVDEVNHYKHLYMGTKVDYSEGGDFGLLFFADKLLFGFASFSTFLGTSDKRKVFLQSDFVVNSNVPKLSKLVLWLLRSEETRKLVLERCLYNYRGVQTAVFTNKPVSMKYRGVFNLLRRENGKLVYVADFLKDSAKTLYKRWLQKTQQQKS